MVLNQTFSYDFLLDPLCVLGRGTLILVFDGYASEITGVTTCCW